MKLVELKCKNCGNTLKINENFSSDIITCEYCHTSFKIDNESKKIKILDAKEFGYEFEKGRIEAKNELSKKSNNNNDSILDGILSDLGIKNWFKKNFKFIMTILLYFLYQFNFILNLISGIGVDFKKIPRTPRILIFTLTDFIYVLIILFMYRKEIINGIKELKKNFLENSLISMKCWLIGCIIMTISSILISHITKQNVSNNEQLVRSSITLAPFYMLFTCSIVAPIFEEMVFRRSLRGFIKNKWLFIILSGTLFGLLHVIGSYNSPLDFLYVIPYGSMGCCFAYLYATTGNISLPIIVHMIHNTILVSSQIIGG